MLSSLHLENVAVVRRADVDFEPGFSVLTGETGAGKSMIIDAVNLLLGERSTRELIRAGEDYAAVSAVFTGVAPEVREKLLAADLDDAETDEVLLSRRVGTDGKSRVKINGRPATVATLREIAPLLIGIYGQNDSRFLLQESAHIDLLDRYGGYDEAAQSYRAAFARYADARRRLARAKDAAKTKTERADILAHRVAEIAALKITNPDEEDKLLAERARLREAERITKNVALADRALSGGERGAAIYLVDRALEAMQKLAPILPEAEVLARRLGDCRFELEDISAQIGALADFGTESAEDALNRIESRLHAIERLKLKYGATLEELLEMYRAHKRELAELDGSDERIRALEEETVREEIAARAAAEALTAARRTAAASLACEVLETLAFLDMPSVRFAVEIEPMEELTATGADAVRFLLAANPGEKLLPMAKTASGGELSRVMLALRSATAVRHGADTVIFDEIDTGVSGKTAQKIGMKLRALSDADSAIQVLCVTHSAQVAAQANHHYLIRKDEVAGRAETSVAELDRNGRVEELARIIGGIEITEAQRAAALEMLER